MFHQGTAPLETGPEEKYEKSGKTWQFHYCCRILCKLIVQLLSPFFDGHAYTQSLAHWRLPTVWGSHQEQCVCQQISRCTSAKVHVRHQLKSGSFLSTCLQETWILNLYDWDFKSIGLVAIHTTRIKNLWDYVKSIRLPFQIYKAAGDPYDSYQKSIRRV